MTRLRALFMALCVALLVACSGESSDDTRRTAEPVSSGEQRLVNPSDPLVVTTDPGFSVAPGRRVAGQWAFQARLTVASDTHVIDTLTLGLSAGSPADVSSVKMTDATDPTVAVTAVVDASGTASPDLASMDVPFVGPPYLLNLFAMTPAALNAPSAANPPRAGDQVAVRVVGITDDEGMDGDLQGIGSVGPYMVHPSLITVGVPSGSPSLVNGVNVVTFKLDVSGAPGAAVRQLAFDLVPSVGVSVNMVGVSYPFTFNGINVGPGTPGSVLFSTFGATNRTGVAFAVDRPVPNGTIYVIVRFAASGVVSGSSVAVAPLYDSRLGAFKLTSFNAATGGITATPVAGGPTATWSLLWTDSSEALPGGLGHKSSLPTSGDYYTPAGTGGVATTTLVAP